MGNRKTLGQLVMEAAIALQMSERNALSTEMQFDLRRLWVLADLLMYTDTVTPQDLQKAAAWGGQLYTQTPNPYVKN